MKLGTLDIIGDPADYGRGIRLRLGQVDSEGKPLESFTVELDAQKTEHLITYLKGLRDGLGWNKKAAADRSL